MKPNSEWKPITPRQRLAITVCKCFGTLNRDTANAMCLTAYSAAIGRDVKSSDEMTDAEVTRLLERWEQYGNPFCPNDVCKRECAKLIEQSQIDAGQQVLDL